jgi:hypothetical protein
MIAIGAINMDKHDTARTWPTTQGYITSSTMREYRSRSRTRRGTGRTHYSYEPVVEYEYDVNGIPYTSVRIGFGTYRFNHADCMEFLSDYREGGKVLVYYNPQKPQETVLETKSRGQTGLFVTGSIFLVAGVIGGLLFILPAL